MATAEEVYGRDIAFKTDFVPSATGDIETIAGLENVKDALFRRLVTTPGSLIHRPSYGVGIKAFQNRLSSIAAQRDLAQRIIANFARDTRVESVRNIQTLIDSARPEMIQILVQIRLVGYGEQSMTFRPFEGA